MKNICVVYCSTSPAPPPLICTTCNERASRVRRRRGVHGVPRRVRRLLLLRAGVVMRVRLLLVRMRLVLLVRMHVVRVLLLPPRVALLKRLPGDLVAACVVVMRGVLAVMRAAVVCVVLVRAVVVSGIVMWMWVLGMMLAWMVMRRAYLPFAIDMFRMSMRMFFMMLLFMMMLSQPLLLLLLPIVIVIVVLLLVPHVALLPDMRVSCVVPPDVSADAVVSVADLSVQAHGALCAVESLLFCEREQRVDAEQKQRGGADRDRRRVARVVRQRPAPLLPAHRVHARVGEPRRAVPHGGRAALSLHVC